MRIITRYLLGTLLMQLPLSFAAGFTGIEACSGQSQADQRICLEATVKTGAAALAQAEQAALAAVARWDEDLRYRSAAGTSLQAANKSFVQFRLAECALAAALGGGAAGNARELRRLACVADLNHARTTHLRQQIADLAVR